MQQTHRPRKRFGQHFLNDQGIIERIVTAIRPHADDQVVEIGPGTGVLTRPLLSRLTQLHVIELDRDLAARLRAAHAEPHLYVHEIDVLKMDFASLQANMPNPNKKLKVIGNLPYNISTPLIFHLLAAVGQISEMVFMVQKEVADRMAAETGSKAYGRLSVMLQYLCETEFLFDVPPEAFDPPPKVMSSVIRLIPREATSHLVDSLLFEKLVKQAFSQRRKTLRNVLKGIATEEDMQAVAINATARSETLSLDDYVRLANHLSQT